MPSAVSTNLECSYVDGGGSIRVRGEIGETKTRIDLRVARVDWGEETRRDVRQVGLDGPRLFILPLETKVIVRENRLWIGSVAP